MTTLNSIDANVGHRIRERRLALKMPAATIAKGLGVSVQQLHKYEKGINRVPAGRLHLISMMLDLPVSMFFDFTPVPLSGDEWQHRPESLLRNTDVRRLNAAYLRIAKTDVRRAVFLIIEAIADGDSVAPETAPTHGVREHGANHADD